MSEVRIRTLRTESFEALIPKGAYEKTIADIREYFLAYAIAKTGEDREELDPEIEFDEKNSKFVLICAEKILEELRREGGIV